MAATAMSAGTSPSTPSRDEPSRERPRHLARSRHAAGPEPAPRPLEWAQNLAARDRPGARRLAVRSPTVLRRTLTFSGLAPGHTKAPPQRGFRRWALLGSNQ